MTTCNMQKNLVKFGHVVSEIYECTDRQTDRQTDTVHPPENGNKIMTSSAHHLPHSD